MTKRPRHPACSRAEAVQRVTAEHLEQVLHPAVRRRGPHGAHHGPGRLARGGRGPGRTSPPTTPPAAAERGERVILVRSETSPEDVHGMLAAEGILTARGGLVSHAAVVARGWGKPAVVGAEKVRIDRHVVHGRAAPSCTRATGSPSTAPPARWSSGQVALAAAEPSRGVRRPSSAGPTRSARATSRCGPTPTTGPTPPTPGASGPRASGCAGPSTCSSPRTACPSCGG